MHAKVALLVYVASLTANPMAADDPAVTFYISGSIDDCGSTAAAHNVIMEQRLRGATEAEVIAQGPPPDSKRHVLWNWAIVVRDVYKAGIPESGTQEDTQAFSQRYAYKGFRRCISLHDTLRPQLLAEKQKQQDREAWEKLKPYMRMWVEELLHRYPFRPSPRPMRRDALRT